MVSPETQVFVFSSVAAVNSDSVVAGNPVPVVVGDSDPLTSSCSCHCAFQILLNLEIQMRFFLTGKKNDSCLKFKMKRILTDQSGIKKTWKELQDI
jgi:hypothetical protein